MFDEFPISTIKLPEGRLQTFPDISLSEELKWKSCRPKNKTFIRRASPGIPIKNTEIKTPKAGEDGMLLLRNGKFVIWKYSLTCIATSNHHHPIPGDGVFGKWHPSAHGYRVMCLDALKSSTLILYWHLNNVKYLIVNTQTELCSFFKPLRTNSRVYCPLFTGR